MLQCTIRRTTHEKLLYVRALLGHKLPSGDIPEIIDQALDSLIHEVEKAKFAATDIPRKLRGPSRFGSRIGTRHVPAEVKRAVWQRDGGQCTYERSNGQRCQARTRLALGHWESSAQRRVGIRASRRVREVRSQDGERAERPQ